MKGQSPGSGPFTVPITLATAHANIRVISYPSILSPFPMKSTPITGSPYLTPRVLGLQVCASMPGFILSKESNLRLGGY